MLRAPTASPTVAAAPAPARSASRPSTAGRTTATSTRRAACSGRSSRKYGRKLSWADLIVLTGNVAMESMGFKTFGFGGGRADIWEPEEDIYWGPETTWLGDERYKGDRELDNPLGAVQMGLIYVNPGRPERQAGSGRLGARHPRDLRPHGDGRRGDRGAHRRRPHLRQGPRRRRRRPCRSRTRRRRHRGAGPGLEEQLRHRQGRDTITSGIEGAWTPNPIQWDNGYFETCSATNGS
jgi:catalase-peroxidase